ncbi:MAG: fumarate hydratase C-terminal domain-containing protein [Treponema sp.]|nr:fumarate hydratase C-terminal domain-containing protein [Treponema sp.]
MNVEDFDFIPFADGVDLGAVTEAAFNRLSFTFTEKHIRHIIAAALAPDASDNDRSVCAALLKNAQIAAEGRFPLCQDTGIATVFGWQTGSPLDLSSRVYASGDSSGKAGREGDAYEAITQAVSRVYDTRRLRFSTACPSSFYDEYDPKNNLPAQITLFSGRCALAPVPPFALQAGGSGALSMIFTAKGGGSSNKTSFVSGTKAYLSPERFRAFMREQIEHFGTSACPPYTIAVVAGGLSPEQNLLTLKLATCGAYDDMTYEPNPDGFRDRELEEEVMKIACETGYGAQFGGTRFALEAIVIRLPRHGASCPLSAGVSCSAHRNVKAVVTEKGFYLEKTCAEPERVPGFSEAVRGGEAHGGAGEASVRTVRTDGGLSGVLDSLRGAVPGERVLVSGPILVARDAAHARWKALIDAGKPLPDYCSRYPICYAGPARTPDGAVIGSFGPTTAGRMDVYAEMLMSRGAALVTLAKGNRSKEWTKACAKYGAFYLGTPGGIAALIASSYITAQEVLDYEDLGMEAVRLVTVQNLPAYVITNDKGEDFYAR